MLRNTLLVILVIAVGGFSAGVARAHGVLETADPAQGATVASPKEVRLTFSEDLIAQFSGLTVEDQAGQPIETGSPMIDPNHKRQLVLPISKPLQPGTYEVVWHAVSVDTHKASGHFSFKVAQ